MSRFNGSDAARRVGISKASAASQASRWLRNQVVIALLATEREELEAKINLEEHELIREFATLAMLDIRDILRWDKKSVTIKASVELTPELARCIAGIEENLTEAGKTIKIKFHDRLRAMDALAKMKGLYDKKRGRGGAVLQFIGYDEGDDDG